jgi:hypothetical protein
MDVKAAFTPKSGMSIDELLDGGVRLVDENIDQLASDPTSLGLDDSKRLHLAYQNLEKTYSLIIDDAIPSERDSDFNKVEKARYIGVLGSYIPWKGSDDAFGYYNLVDWFAENGDSDCVVPLLKFGMASHIVARDKRGWFFGGTSYASRINHSIN